MSRSNSQITWLSTDINQSNGTPAFGHTGMAYDARGLRSYDDNTTTLTNDRRDYTYDARHNVVNVRGQYYTGGVWHYYDVGSSFDHRNRRVYKSFYDETTLKTAQWFFYYDSLDRLTEIRYTPDSSVSGTYSVFQMFWLSQKLVMFWQSDYVSNVLNATSKRYVASDETDRPIQLWNWPASGDATLVWAINPRAWGVDTNIVGPTVFQPFLFAGQYEDTEPAAYENDGVTIHRAGVALNGVRTYDQFTGGYLQFDPAAEESRSSYVYAENNPVGVTDPSGKLGINVTVTQQETVDVCLGASLTGQTPTAEGALSLSDENQADCLANTTNIDGCLEPGCGGVIDGCSLNPELCPDPPDEQFPRLRISIDIDCLKVNQRCNPKDSQSQRCVYLRCTKSYCSHPIWVGRPCTVGELYQAREEKNEYYALGCDVILEGVRCKPWVPPLPKWTPDPPQQDVPDQYNTDILQAGSLIP